MSIEDVSYRPYSADASYGPVTADGRIIGYIALVYKSRLWNPLTADTWLAISSLTPLVVDQASLVHWAAILANRNNGNIVVAHCASEEEAVKMVVDMDANRERWVAEAAANVSPQEDFDDE